MCSTLHEAFHVARSGRPGPVVVDLPKDIQLSECEYINRQDRHGRRYKPIINPEKNKSICALCTGGFNYIANKVKTDLGFQHLQANTLEIKNDIITGKLLKPIFNENSKLEFLKYLSKKYNVSKNETCAIGDGANDIKVIKNASLGASYKGKEILNKQAKIIIKHSDLTALLFLQGFKKDEIVN